MAGLEKDRIDSANQETLKSGVLASHPFNQGGHREPIDNQTE